MSWQIKSHPNRQQPKQKMSPWYVGTGHLLYPQLFSHGYKFFLRTIDVHNKRWPDDYWPVYPYDLFLRKAKEVARMKYRRRHPKFRSFLEQNKKYNSEFYRWMINEHGGWPLLKNPWYTKGDMVDIAEEKKRFFRWKMQRAYERAKRKSLNK